MMLLTTPLAGGAKTSISIAVLLALCLLAIALLMWRRGRLLGTTLTGAWWWAVGSILAIATGELVLATLSDAAQARCASPLRFITATSTFCPGVFVLGARRPHAGAWHWVVLSMWGMFALPAFETLFLGRGMAMELGPIRGWFLWIAVGIVSLNYLPTRHWLSALLFAAGQIVLLSPYLPLLGAATSPSGAGSRELLGLLLCVAALAVAVVRTRAARSAPQSAAQPHPLDEAWLSFRDTFGGLWALRVFERMAFASRTYRWPVSLFWWGFEFHDAAQQWSDVDEKTTSEIRQTLDNLLRRFVDVRVAE